MDVTTLIAFIAALGGSAGLAALVKALSDNKTMAKQHDLNVLREVVNQLQEENKRLCERVLAYETTIIELRAQVLAQKVEIDDLRSLDRKSHRQLEILRRELTKAQHHIAELMIENEKLQKQVNGKRDA